MPRLRILAGPSTTDLKPIRANCGEATDVSSDLFEGRVAVYIKNFADSEGKVQDSAYFEHEDRKDVTWSIQVQGRFLQRHTANDVLFGNVFDRPLPIPWGFSTILGFMQYIDPTLEHDLTSKDQPWALSPLISTMPYFSHARTQALHDVLPFPPIAPLREDTSQLKLPGATGPDELAEGGATKRRMFFRQAETRKGIVFGPEDVITTDFCYNYLSFSPSSVALSLPGGFGLDLTRYWDGQPIYFVCCERASTDKTGVGQRLGRIFWCVAIEVLEGEEEEEEEEEEEGSADEEDEDETQGEPTTRNDDVD